MGREGGGGGRRERQTTWYRGTHGEMDLEHQMLGAAGEGLYLAQSQAEAGTWGENTRKIMVTGNILPLGMASDSFIRRAEKRLGTKHYSQMVSQGDRPANYSIYDALRRKLGNVGAARAMVRMGYVGVEHASPRRGFPGNSNLVIFKSSAVKFGD